jgi:hypothetical protein
MVVQEPDKVTGAVVVPISLATTFAQPTPGAAPGKDSELSYHRGFEVRFGLISDQIC